MKKKKEKKKSGWILSIYLSSTIFHYILTSMEEICVSFRKWAIRDPNGEIPSICHRSTVWLGSSVVRVLTRYARGPGFESRSGRVLFPPLWHLHGGSVWVLSRAVSRFVPSRFHSEQIRGRIYVGGNCHKSTVWLGSLVVRVLARYARGPGFESQSGHVLLPPLWA